MTKDELPRFVIYQPNQKEFHICLQVGNKFHRWSSYYAPTIDTRYQREMEQIADIPINKIPKGKVYDEGTYTVTKSDSKETAEKKLTEGLTKKSFAFILNGKKLKGRFSIKRVSTGTVIQKFKDKYATEEDVLSGDLSRTISTMIPDYDETKITLNPTKKTGKMKVTKVEDEPEEELTPNKTIGNKEYHFAFYTSETGPEICLITSDKTEVIVLRKHRNKWEVAPSASNTVLKSKQEFIEHASKLYNK